MKISVIGPTYPYKGGISHYNTLLCKYLAKKHEVSIISFKRLYPKFLYPGKEQKDKESKKRLGLDNVEYVIDSLNPFTWIKAVFNIKREKPALLIFHWWTPFFAFVFFVISFLIKKLTNAKVLFICHNVMPHEKTLIDRALSKLVFSNVDFFIVHSKEDMANLKSLVPRAVARQTFHPTYEVFKFKEMSKEKVKKELGIASDKVILFFGYVREYKGLAYLIEAMPRVLEKLDVALLIVGEFWDSKEKYLGKIDELGLKEKVKIIDKYVPNEEIGLYFSAADVVVLPYISATQSGIVQIAYGFNKPVITTNIGGLPDVVRDGETGLIVESKNSNALAETIIAYFEEGKEKEFAKNIMKEREKFSWNKIVRVIQEF